MTLVGGAVLVAATVALAALVTGNNLYTLGVALVHRPGCPFAGVALGLRRPSVALPVHTVGPWIVGHDQGCRGRLDPRGAGSHRTVRRGRRDTRPPGPAVTRLYMALATLAFAALMDSLFFTNPSIIPNGSMIVGRPDIFGMRFTTDRAFVVLIAIVFALCLIGVGALRRGPFGRRLVAMSDSQAACATVGMSITKTKLSVFILAGGIAGLAGALYGGMSRTVSFSQFDFVESLVLFVAVALAGITILSGVGASGHRSGCHTAHRPAHPLHLRLYLHPVRCRHRCRRAQSLRARAGLLAPGHLVGRTSSPFGCRRGHVGQPADEGHRALVSTGGVFRWLTSRPQQLAFRRWWSTTSRFDSVGCKRSTPSLSRWPRERSTA